MRLDILSKRTLCFIACGKEFPILVARVSEIAILSMRFAIKHSFQKNSLLHCLLKRILVLETRVSEIERFFSRYSDVMHSYQKNSLLFILVSRTSILLPWKNGNEMIILIRILVLRRRISYLGNLEWCSSCCW